MISQTFNNVQVTTDNHRKNAAALRKYQIQCAGDSGEEEFNRKFVQCANKILTVKKGDAYAENVVEFIGTYVSYFREKGIFSLGKIISRL
jgi:hypothetical protein